METLIVVNEPDDWVLDIPDIKVVAARDYLMNPSYTEIRARVYNLCRSYEYQRTGYYVSLLAEARKHKPIPNVSTIEDLKSPTLISEAADDLNELIQKVFRHLQSDTYTLSIYFGRNPAKRYNVLCSRLFRLFQAPFVRAYFIRQDEKWYMEYIGPISANDIPVEHLEYVHEFTREYFDGRRAYSKPREQSRYDLAILLNPNDPHAPSNEKSIKRFVKAAETVGFSTELITVDDFQRLPEFDALFIRETTNVHHHTYQFSRKAVADGLVVIDDPDSILKCTNKVFLAEMLRRHKIKAPKTFILHHDNLEQCLQEIGLPCVLKRPDGSFSDGVIKVQTHEEFEKAAEHFMETSDLVIVQEYLPTTFDWRVGVLDQKPLYVCKYHMARKHWQIVLRDEDGKTKDQGRVNTFEIDDVNPLLISTAVKAANLIGNGLYGVDVKQVDKKYYVIEVNDNPSIDAGIEDMVLKDELYLTIMRSFAQRIERKRQEVLSDSSPVVKEIQKPSP
ncbi:MAG: RimK family protein [SAR324 cluster bacterium]|nr:RimK family protein [SAR324 cluster bacterium]